MHETNDSLKNHNTIVKSATPSVSSVINSIRTTEGEGFVVNRPFPSNSLSDFPFLLLDEMGPMDLAPGEAKGRQTIQIEVLKLLDICWKVDLNIKTHVVMQESSIQEMCNG
jgi:hypothetical protein